MISVNHKIAHIVNIKATRHFCVAIPNFQEVMQYLVQLLPQAQSQESHKAAMKILTDGLAVFNMPIQLLVYDAEEEDVLSDLDQSDNASLVLSLNTHITIH